MDVTRVETMRPRGGSSPLTPLRPCRCVAPAVLALPLLAASALAQGHHGTIVGTVTSSDTGDPLGGVELTVQDTDLRETTTGQGHFRFAEVPPGRRTLALSYLGTPTSRVLVDVRPRQTIDLSLVVGVRVVPITELVVTVDRALPVGKLTGFYQRREIHAGYFITREDIERVRPVRTTSLLRRVPGLDVGQRSASGVTPVTMGRRKGCVPDFYVDGARAPYFDVDVLDPQEIAGIEIYRGNSEVPIRFKHRDRCGVIVIWTTDPGGGEEIDG